MPTSLSKVVVESPRLMIMLPDLDRETGTNQYGVVLDSSYLMLHLDTQPIRVSHVEPQGWIYQEGLNVVPRSMQPHLNPHNTTVESELCGTKRTSAESVFLWKCTGAVFLLYTSSSTGRRSHPVMPAPAFPAGRQRNFSIPDTSRFCSPDIAGPSASSALPRSPGDPWRDPRAPG